MSCLQTWHINETGVRRKRTRQSALSGRAISLPHDASRSKCLSCIGEIGCQRVEGIR
jgi:hypothetical protein